VAERKTIADLASSISDGRYIEQKSRLKACNLRSTIYIIEGEHIVVPTQQRAITAASIKTAIVSINVIFLLSTIIIYQLTMYYTTILLLSYLSRRCLHAVFDSIGG
jgi:ERCC4-type nuclease